MTCDQLFNASLLTVIVVFILSVLAFITMPPLKRDEEKENEMDCKEIEKLFNNWEE